MDTFLEGCQGLGLALAVGMLAGTLAALLPREGVLTVFALVGAVGGATLFGWSLTQADHSAWPGWPLGFAVALFAFAVARGVVAGAVERAREASPAGIAAPLVLVALVLAGLSLAVPPVSLLAGVALVWLAAARRRRTARKYEGLRVLR
jgi:hypothetical protein